jgi:pimeloyl-ACP methyl ester carboxylesterase
MPRRGRRLGITLLTGLLLVCVPRAGWPQAADAPIPLGSWDDDWDFPEGRLRIAGQRFSLGLGASVSVFEDATARGQYGSHVVDPEITLYRPTRKGLSPDLGFVWVGLGRSDSAARYIAPTLGVRYAFVDGLERRRPLVAAGESAPYVLVGHSFGGLNVRAFAAEHRAEVAGLVLVDASHEDQSQRFPAEVKQQTDAALRQVQELAAKAARGETTPPIVSYMPRSVARRPAWYATLAEELTAWDASTAELRACERSLRIPLVVVSAERPASIGRSRVTRRETRRLWDEMQEELSRLSPVGTRMIAHRIGHYIQRQEPRVVIDAVRQGVEAARTAGETPRPRGRMPARYEGDLPCP